jgi:hypothetical protein
MKNQPPLESRDLRLPHPRALTTAAFLYCCAALQASPAPSPAAAAGVIEPTPKGGGR